MTAPVCRPIGVFDSGIGGLSVLRALRLELPHEQLVYLADSGNAPYGDARGATFVRQRSLEIACGLQRQYHIKALVIACNTATAAAIESLRTTMSELPVIGVEPALAPAARNSNTHCVGVLATRSTLASQRFQRLLAAYGEGTRFTTQACDGLAQAIETYTALPPQASSEKTEVWQLCARYVTALGTFGRQAGEIDSLVLGCTHYALVDGIFASLVMPEVRIWSCGDAVARQTRRVLEQSGMLAPPSVKGNPIRLYTTGKLAALQAAAAYCLDSHAFDFQCAKTAAI